MQLATNAQFSKLRMVDNVVKDNWLSMKVLKWNTILFLIVVGFLLQELTELIACCVEEKDKLQIVEVPFCLPPMKANNFVCLTSAILTVWWTISTPKLVPICSQTSATSPPSSNGPSCLSKTRVTLGCQGRRTHAEDQGGARSAAEGTRVCGQGVGRRGHPVAVSLRRRPSSCGCGRRRRLYRKVAMNIKCTKEGLPCPRRRACCDLFTLFQRRTIKVKTSEIRLPPNTEAEEYSFYYYNSTRRR